MKSNVLCDSAEHYKGENFSDGVQEDNGTQASHGSSRISLRFTYSRTSLINQSVQLQYNLQVSGVSTRHTVFPQIVGRSTNFSTSS